MMIKKFLLILWPFSSAVDYSLNEALRALDLSELSYCVNGRNERCLMCPESITVTDVIKAEISGGLAVVGYDALDASVFVAYRGSSNTRNWIENVKFVKTRPYENYPLAAVERGFYLWYRALNASVYPAVRETVRNYGASNLKVTGHSAGGACATLFAFDVGMGMFQDLKFLSSITFGSPRVGDIHFKNLYESFQLRTLRVTHYHDIVPHMPMERSLHFYHVPTEIYYNSDFSTVTICDSSGEDPTCSNKCAPLHCTSVSDHLFYLNTTVGSAGCAIDMVHTITNSSSLITMHQAADHR